MDLNNYVYPPLHKFIIFNKNSFINVILNVY